MFKQKLKHALFIGLCCSLPCALSAQTSYLFCPSLQNPSAIGKEENISFTLIGQHSLTGFQKAPKTAALSTIFPIATHRRKQKQSIAEKPLVIGLSAKDEFVGIHQDLEASLLFAFRIHLKKNLLMSFGVAGGIHWKTSNYKNLLQPDNLQDKALENQINTYKSYLILQAKVGIAIDGENFNVSLFMPTLLESPIYGLEAHWHTKNKGKGQFEIHARTMYEPKKKTLYQNVGIVGMVNKNFGIGISWQNPKNIAAMLLIHINKLSINYTFHLNGFNQYQMGHEIGVKVGVGRGKTRF